MADVEPQVDFVAQIELQKSLPLSAAASTRVARHQAHTHLYNDQVSYIGIGTRGGEYF